MILRWKNMKKGDKKDKKRGKNMILSNKKRPFWDEKKNKKRDEKRLNKTHRWKKNIKRGKKTILRQKLY